MKLTVAKTAKEQREFLRFRRYLYSGCRRYIDDNYFMICEIFSDKLHFTKNIKYYPVYVSSDSGNILCEGIIVYAPQLPEYIQLCFFESLPHQDKAIDMLTDLTKEYGRRLNCKRMVVGLNGHVNYGLGLLDSHFEERNSFSSPGNPMFYNDHFRKAGFEETGLNSYVVEHYDDRLERFRRAIERIDKNYEFRYFDKKQFDTYSKIYTDLNNYCFSSHKYYYCRDYEDDKEMLKELFLFMKEDSLIFAFKDEEPVGFIMWYPDFNELAARGSIFGTKHFLKNLISGRKIRTAKVMEYGVLKGYRGRGLPAALIYKAFNLIREQGYTRIETSWVLEDNDDSNSFCRAACDSLYKKYVVFEKEL